MGTRLGSRLEKLGKYKQILKEQGEEIFADVLSNIPSRAPDKETMEFALRKQDEFDDLAGSILGILYMTMTHIPANKLFGDINMLVGHMMRRLGGSRFYIFLSAQLNCNIKSNTFLATMSMCQNNEMAEGLQDFICAKETLYTSEIDAKVTDYVYLDDATFSGVQLRENIQYLALLLGEHVRNCSLHVIIPYINPGIMEKVRVTRHPFKNIEWYTTETYPEPVSGALHTIFSKHPDVEASRIYSTLDNLLGDRNSSPMIKSYNKALFYTDLKVPDYVSVYTAFLQDHAILFHGQRARMKHYGRELIKGCMPRFDPSVYADSDGNDCPYPLYKEQKWKDFVESWIPNHLF